MGGVSGNAVEWLEVQGIVVEGIRRATMAWATVALDLVGKCSVVTVGVVDQLIADTRATAFVFSK